MAAPPGSRPLQVSVPFTSPIGLFGRCSTARETNSFCWWHEMSHTWLHRGLWCSSPVHLFPTHPGDIARVDAAEECSLGGGPCCGRRQSRSCCRGGQVDETRTMYRPQIEIICHLGTKTISHMAATPAGKSRGCVDLRARKRDNKMEVVLIRNRKKGKKRKWKSRQRVPKATSGDGSAKETTS